MDSPKKTSSQAIVSVWVIIALVFFLFGWSAGQSYIPAKSTGVYNANEGAPEEVDFSPFWKTWNVLNEKYVGASSTAERVDNQTKVWGAIQGLADSLEDPYTVFFPPVENSLFESDIRGNFEGVGMEILAQDGAITVIAPLKGSPAEKAGLHAGDKIIKIGDKVTASLTTDEAVGLIRGEKGTQVSFTVFRDGEEEPFEVKVTRAVIDIPTISTEELSGGVFLIELYNFSANSPNLFRQALREFIISGKSRLVIDLRGNPGGYLEAAIDMASWFLPAGKVIVREDFGAEREEKIYRSKGYDVFNENLKLAILVNGGSASASEILAGALREHNRAILVGEKTFGKGSVQELVSITPETSLKVTIARWLTPNGLSISKAGIVPDEIVEMTTEDRKAGRDPQLKRAIEILK